LVAVTLCAALVVPILCAAKDSEVGATDTCGTPAPTKLTVGIGELALLRMLKVPVGCTPSEVGVNVSATVQLPPPVLKTIELWHVEEESIAYSLLAVTESEVSVRETD